MPVADPQTDGVKAPTVACQLPLFKSSTAADLADLPSLSHIVVHYPTVNLEGQQKSASISEACVQTLGIQDRVLPAQSSILTTCGGGQLLQTVGWMSNLFMTVRPNRILHLKYIPVIRHFSNQLVLGDSLLQLVGACPNSNQPSLWVSSGFILMLVTQDIKYQELQ